METKLGQQSKTSQVSPNLKYMIYSQFLHFKSRAAQTLFYIKGDEVNMGFLILMFAYFFDSPSFFSSTLAEFPSSKV